MPELGDTRKCPLCGGTQTFIEIGRSNIPRPVNPGEEFRESKHRVWQCDRQPAHITRPEDKHTPIKNCKQCGGFMFYTMRLHLDRVVPADPSAGRKYAVPEPGSGWRCFDNPDHIEED